jgi:hypothetical protein
VGLVCCASFRGGGSGGHEFFDDELFIIPSHAMLSGQNYLEAEEEINICRNSYEAFVIIKSTPIGA